MFLPRFRQAKPEWVAITQSVFFSPKAPFTQGRARALHVGEELPLKLFGRADLR